MTGRQDATDAMRFAKWALASTRAWASANDPSATEAQTRRHCQRANGYDARIISTTTCSRAAMLERLAVQSLDDAYAVGFGQARLFIASLP